MEQHSAFKSWCFRKFFLMRLFEETIAFFGSSNWTSTAYGESTHHSFKSHASFTNNRPQLVDAQVRGSSSCCMQTALSCVISKSCRRLGIPPAPHGN